MSEGFGTRARVCHLYPAGGLCDFEIQAMAPDGVQFVTTRVPFRRTGVADDLRFAEHVGAQSELLADAAVELVAVNCTAATMLAGPRRIREVVAEHAGVPAVTTIEAVLGALDHLGVGRVALVTPYLPEVVEAESAYLADHGVEVVEVGGRPCHTPVEQGEIPPQVWVDTVAGLSLDGVDAVLLSCAGVQVAPVIDEIERRTGLPLVTSNQALLWWVLRALRLPEEAPGYGTLLSPEAERRSLTVGSEDDHYA
jgi:maleate isomerase